MVQVIDAMHINNRGLDVSGRTLVINRSDRQRAACVLPIFFWSVYVAVKFSIVGNFQ